MSVNKAIIIGNLGSDPEEIASGKGCRFSIATNERWTDKDGQKQEKTEWHRIVAWGKTADNCVKYLSKGRQVYVEGSIQTDEYTDSDGVDRKSTEIRAWNVAFLSGEAGGGSGGGGRTRKRKKKKRRTVNTGGGKDNPFGSPGKTESFDDSDIPF